MRDRESCTVPGQDQQMCRAALEVSRQFFSAVHLINSLMILFFVRFGSFVVENLLTTKSTKVTKSYGCARLKNSMALPQTIWYFSGSGTPAKFLSITSMESGQSDS